MIRIEVVRNSWQGDTIPQIIESSIEICRRRAAQSVEELDDKQICKGLRAIEEVKSVGTLDDDGVVLVTSANSCTFTIRGDSRSGLLIRDFHRAVCGLTPKEIGPYPEPELSMDEVQAAKQAFSKNNVPSYMLQLT